MVWKPGKNEGNKDDQGGGDKRPDDLKPEDTLSPRSTASYAAWLAAVLKAFEEGLKKSSLKNSPSRARTRRMTMR